MTHTRPLRSWARLTAPGIPAFTVIRRALRTGCDAVLEVGAIYPAPEPGNFAQVRRARQLYQQRRIGPATEIPAAPSPLVKARSRPEVSEVSEEASPMLPDESTASQIFETEAQSANAEESQVDETVERSADEQKTARPAHHKKKGNQPHGT